MYYPTDTPRKVAQICSCENLLAISIPVVCTPQRLSQDASRKIAAQFELFAAADHAQLLPRQPGDSILLCKLVRFLCDIWMGKLFFGSTFQPRHSLLMNN